MADDLQALREKYDLRTLIPGERTTTDRYDQLACPWHDDSEPSLLVFADGAVCKGACGQRYSVIDWVMLTKNLSFREAVNELSEGLELEPQVPKRKAASKASLPPVTKELVEHCVQYTPKHASMYWLLVRQINGAAYAWAQLGYYNHQSSYWGHRYTIPVKDANMQLVGMKLRRDDLKGGHGKRYLNWPGMGQHLYLGYPDYIEHAEVVVVCEGEIDALTILSATDRGWRKKGEKYYPPIWPVSGTGGCGTWHQEWSERLAGAKAVVLAYDNDEAGRWNAALRRAKDIPRADIIPSSFYRGHSDIASLRKAEGIGRLVSYLGG